jgi:hypothetical protein
MPALVNNVAQSADCELSLFINHVTEASAAEMHCCKFTPVPRLML